MMMIVTMAKAATNRMRPPLLIPAILLAILLLPRGSPAAARHRSGWGGGGGGCGLPGAATTTGRASSPKHRALSFLTSRRAEEEGGRSEISSGLPWLLALRGGDGGASEAADAATATVSQRQQQQRESAEEEPGEDELGEKVRRAMIKLGLAPPGDEGEKGSPVSPPVPSAAEQRGAGAEEECEGGVCEAKPPPPEPAASAASAPPPPPAADSPAGPYDAEGEADVIAARLSAELGVDEALCLAAVGATASVSPDGSRRRFDALSARALLRQELDRIATVGEGSEAVKRLVSEGYDPFLSRRALAFADGSMEDARAILDADRMDEKQEEEQRQLRREQGSVASAPPPDLPMRTVAVDSTFDPTAAGPAAPAKAAPSGAAPADEEMPPPARREDVVFDATAAQIQELVIESPVPVLLDVYADWCGPCKALGPALEEMAVKSGGAFRLVKVNADRERAVASSALGVAALPTVFGVRDGKILHSFQGMPRSESFMRSFMTGLLVSEAGFDPPATPAERKVYGELSSKLVKVAGTSSFPFSARERLQDRVSARLDELAAEARDYAEAEESAQVLKSLLSNVVRDPASIKFRTVNLSNKVIAAKVGRFPPSVAILKAVGFVPEGVAGETLVLGKGRRAVNVAPLMAARECIEKWVDKSRYEVAKAARRRRDEEERAKLQLAPGEDEEDDESGDERRSAARGRRRRAAPRERDPDACAVKVRFDGKNKIHELALRAGDPLSAVLDRLAVDASGEVQITCIAKRLTVSSLDPARMQQSLRSLGLAPSPYLVISVGERRRPRSAGGVDAGSDVTAAAPSLSERAAAKQKQKRGSHTMQSVGIYAKDDNNKAELIDGGGGVWYEHDVTDDEEEEEEQEAEPAQEEPQRPQKKGKPSPSNQQQRGTPPPAEDEASDDDEEADEDESGSESLSSDDSDEEPDQ